MKKIVIVTHSGNFHSDDIFGVATICLVLEKDQENREIEIIRTRDREKINAAEYVVDTGDEYNPEKNRFDHHQTGGAGVRENGIPYASFGLVWKKYGVDLVGSQVLADMFEHTLIVPIDARDNGIEITIPAYPGVIPYELRDIVHAFKTTWKEDSSKLDDNFLFLVGIAKEIIKREIQHIKDNFEAKSIILDVYVQLEDKRLLILDTYYPYESAMIDMPEVLLVIYPSLSDHNWCVETVSSNPPSYDSKMLLPENWSGKRADELEIVTGVSGAVFCHNRRFLAVAKTKEAAIELAHIALKEAGK